MRDVDASESDNADTGYERVRFVAENKGAITVFFGGKRQQQQYEQSPRQSESQSDDSSRQQQQW